MAVDFARACQFPEDIDNAFFQLEEEYSNRIIANEALLDAAVADIEDLNLQSQIDTLSNALEELLRSGDGSSNIRSLDDLSEVMGLPRQQLPFNGEGLSEEDKALKDEQDLLEDEQFLFDSGITLFDGVLYLPGDESDNASDATNVEKLREVYGSTNQDLDKLAELLAALEANSPVIVQSQLILERIPAKKINEEAFTFDDIEKILDLQDPLGAPLITTFVNDDFSTVVLRKKFLGLNLSKKKILDTFGVGDEDLITEIFHLNEVVVRPNDLEKMKDLGYTETEFLTMFNRIETENVGLPQSEIESQLAVSIAQAELGIQVIDFFLQRVEQAGRGTGGELLIPTSARLQNQERLNEGIEGLKKLHRKTISSTFFKRVVVIDTAVLARLRENHTDANIKRLLEKRPEVEGIEFGVELSRVLSQLTNSLTNTQPGATASSSAAMVRAIPRGFYNLNILLFMWSDLIEAQDDVLAGIEDPVLVINLRNARQHLVDFTGKDPIRTQEETSEPTIPYKGQPVISTPATIITKRIDYSKTFGLNDLLNNLLNGEAFASLEAGIVSVLQRLINFFENAIRACNKVLDKANKVLIEFKKLIDAFCTQFLSLIGQGSFETSMLKCAVNFDIGISGLLTLPLIQNLLCILASTLGAFLTKFTAWVADFINQVLCVPLGLINAFLGQINDAIPAACQVPTFPLPESIVNALGELQLIGSAKNTTVVFLGKDLVKFRMFVNGLSDKMGQFNNGAGCNGAVGQAYNASILNLQGGATFT